MDMLPVVSFSSGPEVVQGLLEEGDELLAINHELVAGLTHKAIVALLRVVQNTVTLTVLPMETRLKAAASAKVRGYQMEVGHASDGLYRKA